MGRIYLCILFLLYSNVSNAQRFIFSSKNNYAAPIGPPAYITGGLVLHVDAGNNPTYPGSGNISIVEFFKNKGLPATEAANHFSLTKSRFGYSKL